MFKKVADKKMQDYFADMDSYSGIKLKSLYIVDSNDEYTYTNLLLFVYSYDYEHTYFFDDEVEKETKYAYVSFEDLVVNTKGKVMGKVEYYESDIDTGFSDAEALFDYTLDNKATRTKIDF